MPEPADRLAVPPGRRDAAPEPSAQRHDALERRAAAQAATDYGALLNRRPAGPSPVQRAASTGLPAPLKAGVEALSGVGMDDVNVHHGSAQPARLQAHAFTQGTDIHLAPGQEKHLPHEAWHVVQQKQGRVRATRQLKGDVAVNDDAGLEREADLMGARAATAAARADGGAPSPPPRARGGAGRTMNAPVQRYVVQGQYHVAEDNTAAVVDVKNNKELYATNQRIGEANTLLQQRVSNIRLDAGAVKSGSLLTVTPRVVVPHVQENALDPTLSPVDPGGQAATKVHLPSECEKGAVAIIGAAIQDEQAAPNPNAYAKEKHADARIANLIAQSPADDDQKREWYVEWKRLTGIVAKAAVVYNEFAHAPTIKGDANLDAVRAEVRTTDPRIADENFEANFELKDGRWAPTVERLEAGTALESMIKVLDARVNVIERAVMSSIDANYRRDDQDVLQAQALRRELIQLYAARDFPKAIVDRALDMAGRQVDREKYFAAKPDDADRYGNNLNYLSGYRMKGFLEELVAAIGTEILRLEAARDEKFGSTGNRNRAVDPQIGEAYGIVGGGFDFKRGGRWNWHWAGVILKTPDDNVTMEAHASHKQGQETHNDRWDFKMYGRPHALSSLGKTFHDKWRGQGFGPAPVTVLGKANPAGDHRVAEYHLQGLSLADVAKYRKGANDLLGIVRPLGDPRQGRGEIVDHYYGHLDTMLGITIGGLPRQFVEENLHPPLNLQYEAVARLKKEGVEQPEEEELKTLAARASTSVAIRTESLNQALAIYEHAGKKTGELV